MEENMMIIRKTFLSFFSVVVFTITCIFAKNPPQHSLKERIELAEQKILERIKGLLNSETGKEKVAVPSSFKDWNKEIQAAIILCDELKKSIKESDGEFEWVFKIMRRRKLEQPITKKEIAKEILQHWNSKKIVVHKETQEILQAIMAKMKYHAPEEIKEAIDNYAEILKSEKYYWTYKWTLKHFLQRGLERFMSYNEPFKNFLNFPSGRGFTNPNFKKASFPFNPNPSTASAA